MTISHGIQEVSGLILNFSGIGYIYSVLDCILAFALLFHCCFLHAVARQIIVAFSSVDSFSCYLCLFMLYLQQGIDAALEALQQRNNRTSPRPGMPQGACSHLPTTFYGPVSPTLAVSKNDINRSFQPGSRYAILIPQITKLQKGTVASNG